MTDKMYFYEIIWSWCDSYMPKSYYSTKQYTQHEIEQFVNKAIKKCFVDELETDDYIGFCNIDDIFYYINVILEEYEIYPVIYTVITDYYDMYTIDKELAPEEEKRLIIMLGEDLLYRIQEHNKQVSENMLKGDS